MGTWTKEEEAIVLRLMEENRLYREISVALGEAGYDRSGEAVRKFLSRTKSRRSEFGVNVLPDEDIGQRHRRAIESIESLRDQLVEITTKRFAKIGKPVDACKKILCISDPHIPFENVDVISHAIDNHSDADVLVLNGDIFECHAVSRWPKQKAILLRWEYELALKWVKLLSETFPKIQLVSGNHEHRLQSYFSSHVDPVVSFLVEDDLLARLSKGHGIGEDGYFEKQYDFKNVFYDGMPLRWYTKVGKCIFAHPRSSSGIPMRTVVKTAEYFLDREPFQAIVCAHCFDEGTELLTDQGWRDIDTIQESDKPATLNLDSNRIEFNNCEGIHKYSDHSELIAFKNDSGLEVLVTPEHGMLYSTYKNLHTNPRWLKANAEDIEDHGRLTIPASGILDNAENNDTPDETLKLLAWILTEGNIDIRSNGNCITIRIYQSDDGSGFIHEIESLMRTLNIEYTKSLRYKANTYKHNVHRNYDAYRFYIKAASSRRLLPYLDIDTKTLKHELLMSLSLRQRKLLIEEMCKGDGSKCGGDRYRHYYTSNRALLDQFQLLCTLSGIRNKSNIRRDDGNWVVSMTDTTIHTVTSSERRAYSGRTWCLTVPNGTLIARRNGVVFITQNSHKMGKIIWRDRLLIEQGCCCVPLDYESDGQLKYSPQSFGYAVVYMDKNGNVDFEKTNPVYLGTGSPVKADEIAIW